MNKTSVIVTDREAALKLAINKVFPSAVHLLCIWHLGQNVRKNCAHSFHNTIESYDTFRDFWQDLVDALDEQGFYKVWEEMCSRFGGLFQSCLDYVESLLSFKSQWARPWTSQHCHFRNITTSRLKGLHSFLKSFLPSHSVDFYSVYKSLQIAVDSQSQSIYEKIHKDSDLVDTRLRHTLTRQLIFKISSWALEVVLQEIAALDNNVESIDPDSTCACELVRTMALPCAHRIAERQRCSQPITLDDFHSQWHLPTSTRPPFDPSILRILEPVAHITTIANNNAAPKPRGTSRMCGACGLSGHIRTSRKCPMVCVITLYWLSY